MDDIKTKIKNIFTKPQSKYIYFLFFFIPIIYYLFGYQNLDNDFYFLYPTGKYTVSHGFPSTLLFTIHKGYNFIVQQWGSTVIFYFIYSTFGKMGMLIFIFLCYLLIIYLSYKLCYIISEKRSTSVFISCLMSFFLATIFIRTRPQVFDYIIFLIEFILLESYFKKNERKYLLGLPILSLLMINLHASSFFLLFIFMLPYFIGTFKIKILDIESKKHERIPFIITALIMFLTGFVNPYGIKSISYIFTSYGNFYINDLVTEMKAPLITDSLGFTIYVGIILVYFLYFIFRNNKKIEIRYFFLLLGTTFLALSSIKAFPYFVIASYFPLASYINDKFPKNKNISLSNDAKIDFITTICTMVIMMIIVFIASCDRTKNLRIDKITNYLVKEEKKNKTKYKVYTNYDNGSYAEFKELNVYIDSRAEAYLKVNNKKEDIIKEYYYMNYGGIDKEKFLLKYKFDYLIVDENESLYRFYLNTKDNKLYKKIMTENNPDKDTYLYKKLD